MIYDRISGVFIALKKAGYNYAHMFGSVSAVGPNHLVLTGGLMTGLYKSELYDVSKDKWT